MLAFTAELMQHKEYYRAVTKYRRFLFTFPHGTKHPMAHFHMCLAFYYGRDYGDALEVFEKVAKL